MVFESISKALVVFFLLTTMSSFPQAVFSAEGSNGEQDPSNQTALSGLDEAFGKITSKKQDIESLKQRIAATQGSFQEFLETRLDNKNLRLMELGVEYGKSVASEQADDPLWEKHRTQAVRILREHGHLASATIEKVLSRAELPKPDLSALQLAALYRDLLKIQVKIEQSYNLLFEQIILLRKFEIDVKEYESSLKEKLDSFALNLSIFIEMQDAQIANFQESVSISPDDTELKAKLNVSVKYLKQLAEQFIPILELMDSLEMDTLDYREQVVQASGTITADVAEIGVLGGLLVGWGQTLWEVLIEDGPDLIFKILLFLVILFVFIKLSKIVKRIVEGALDKSKLQISELLRRMLVSIVRNVILILGFLIALSQVGISLGPLLAGFGIVGFVIGFALQDSLANFASGLMILTYRPYDVGDLIVSGSISGRVSHMSLVNTTVMTFDNQTIIVPNNKIWGDVIQNVTAQTTRRIDMVFGISYSDDIAKAEGVLQQILESHEKVLADPEPMVRLHELADSSVNFIVRPWVKKDDYWEVYWDITRTVKITFDQEGISIPFPQRDVHVYTETG